MKLRVITDFQNDIEFSILDEALRECWDYGMSARSKIMRKAVKNAESRLAQDFAYKPAHAVLEPTIGTYPYGGYRPLGERPI